MLRGKKVFIVEDNIQNRTIYQIMMMRSGAIVTFDRWGKNTLQKMRSFAPIDVIIMDLMMPQGKSGYEIFKLIQENSEFADVPVVAVSASDPLYAIPKTQAMGFRGFISKPIDDDLFAQQIASIITGETCWYDGNSYYETTTEKQHNQKVREDER